MTRLLAEIKEALANGPLYVGGMRHFAGNHMIAFYYLLSKIDVVFIEAVYFDTGSEEPLLELSSPEKLTRVLSFAMEKKTTKMRPFGLKLTIQSGTDVTAIEFGFKKCAYHKRRKRFDRTLDI